MQTKEADGAFCVCMPMQMRCLRGTLLPVRQLLHDNHNCPFELADGFPLPVNAQLQHTCSSVTVRTQAELIRRSARQEEKSARTKLMCAKLSNTLSISSSPFILSFSQVVKEKPMSSVLRCARTDLKTIWGLNSKPDVAVMCCEFSRPQSAVFQTLPWTRSCSYVVVSHKKESN